MHMQLRHAMPHRLSTGRGPFGTRAHGPSMPSLGDLQQQMVAFTFAVMDDSVQDPVCQMSGA